MISKYTYKKLTWIDVESPTKEEITHLQETYKISSAVCEELLTSTVRSRVDVYDDFIFTILHFPETDLTNDNLDQEIDFIIGKDFLITVHYQLNNPIHKFSKSFEVDAMLERNIKDSHAGYLFYAIIKELYKDSVEYLDDINSQLRDIEERIFNKTEENIVYTISKVNRKLLDFKQAIRFHKETLYSFERAGKEFFGAHFDYYLSAMIGEYNKVQSILDEHKEILNDLHETNDALIGAKTNDTIKTLTVMNFIMLPLTLITGVFGMNTNFIFIKTLSDFYIVIGAMTLTGIVMFVYFKLRKWL